VKRHAFKQPPLHATIGQPFYRDAPFPEVALMCGHLEDGHVCIATREEHDHEFETPDQEIVIKASPEVIEALKDWSPPVQLQIIEFGGRYECTVRRLGTEEAVFAAYRESVKRTAR